MLTDDIRLRILRELERDPQLSQRELSLSLGVSVGKTNYCLRALIDKGLVKAKNFRRSDNKRAYAYFLTPRGLSDKARLTKAFLKIKLNEYGRLQKEIEELRKEIAEPGQAREKVSELDG